MSARQLLVCYGGTFDPVHNGHLAVARAARDALDARVALLPAHDPPHKGPTRADATQRAAMLDLAIAGEPGLSVDRRELLRAGPSYSFDTLGELRARQAEHAAEVVEVLLAAQAFVERILLRHDCAHAFHEPRAPRQRFAADGDRAAEQRAARRVSRKPRREVSPFDLALVQAGGWVEFADRRY